MKSLPHSLQPLLALGLFLGFSTFCHAEDQASGAMTALLKSIPVKELNYEGASLAKVLTDLQETAKTHLNPENKVPIRLLYTKKGGETTSPSKEPRVSLNLKNTSLYEALTMIGMLNGLDLKVDSKGVTLAQSEDLSLDSW